MLLPEIMQFLVHYMSTFVYLISCGTPVCAPVLAVRIESTNKFINVMIACLLCSGFLLLFFLPMKNIFKGSSDKSYIFL